MRAWIAARSWTSGDGPKTIFTYAVAWLRERDVQLPGMTTLTRLVSNVREETTQQLWRVLESLATPPQRHVLEQLLQVPAGARVSDLERWRKGPPPRGSGPAIITALERVREIMDLGFAARRLQDVVPPRRLIELSRYGMTAKASQLRRHPDARRWRR